jgi:PTS system nitrogen regulatory IIA component
MEITDLITLESVLPSLKAGTKKQVLHELSRKAAAITGQPERTICDVLVERERLGSTGVGLGIAIPHGKLPGIERIVGVFARLDKPIDFDAIDDQPVDLVFLLLAPAGAGAEHLRALARVSRLLRDRPTCAKLRGTENPVAIYSLLTEDSASSHAA